MAGLEEYISTPMDETYGEGAELFREGYVKKIDDELGLEIVEPVERPSIFAKYGVKCDPAKNSFHKSLYDQYQARGTLSPKQINALKR